MDRQQATELYTLIKTVRHVKEMDVEVPMNSSSYTKFGCLLCEGVRHGLYDRWDGRQLDFPGGFALHFGCTEEEASDILYHCDLRPETFSPATTGEIYYQVGKELLIKYGYGDLFEETAMPFNELMDKMKSESLEVLSI